MPARGWVDSPPGPGGCSPGRNTTSTRRPNSPTADPRPDWPADQKWRKSTYGGSSPVGGEILR